MQETCGQNNTLFDLLCKPEIPGQLTSDFSWRMHAHVNVYLIQISTFGLFYFIFQNTEIISRKELQFETGTSELLYSILVKDCTRRAMVFQNIAIYVILTHYVNAIMPAMIGFACIH